MCHISVNKKGNRSPKLMDRDLIEGFLWSHIILSHYFIMFNPIQLTGMITIGLIHVYVHLLYPYCFHDTELVKLANTVITML